MAIRFGTSGWRSIIADEFTFDNVRNVSEAICSYLTIKKLVTVRRSSGMIRGLWARSLRPFPQKLLRKRIPRAVMHRANTYAHNIACDPE